MSKDLISENFKRVLERIEESALSVGREPEQVRLVVVTKGHPLEIVQQAVSAGAQILGENYVQEALPKISLVEGEFDGEWHMIGHVQRRKARPVCENFDWVQTLDSLELAKRLNRFANEIGKKLPVLLEFNVSGEESKYGWIAWNNLEWEELADEISPILELNNLVVNGLMTMAPFLPDPELARPYFVRLRRLRDYLNTKYPGNNWEELSMGMSSDYEVAIQEGATFVRIGTALLGERKL
jgi:pyridoxal phosphate enzyme (YggS family)